VSHYRELGGVRGELFGGAQRGRGRDVEVAGVGVQVVRGAFDLEERRHLPSGSRGAGADESVEVFVIGDRGDLNGLLEPGAGT
jgi:hypothetical protein